MHLFTSFIKRLLAHTEKPLGRWHIDYCAQALHRKVTMNNEDHCGTCGNTVIQGKLDTDEEVERIRYML
jgi:hypothetical protein